MKKLLTLVFAVMVSVGLLAAQNTGGDKDMHKGHKGKAATSDHDHDHDKDHHGKKGHKGGKKSKKGSSTGSTPPPK